MYRWKCRKSFCGIEIFRHSNVKDFSFEIFFSFFRRFFCRWISFEMRKNVFHLQVAWMHFEQSAILTVHNHVITRNPRISVTHDKHDKHKTWYLHISNVQEEDKGRYMCQINTVTAKTQFGYLHVVGEYWLKHIFFLFIFGLCVSSENIFIFQFYLHFVNVKCICSKWNGKC